MQSEEEFWTQLAEELNGENSEVYPLPEQISGQTVQRMLANGPLISLVLDEATTLAGLSAEEISSILSVFRKLKHPPKKDRNRKGLHGLVLVGSDELLDILKPSAGLKSPFQKVSLINPLF